MKKKKTASSGRVVFPSFEEHEKEQVRYAYRNSTALQRLTWLEQAILLFSHGKKKK